MENNQGDSGTRVYSVLELSVILAGLYAFCGYLHYLIKLFVAEPNFTDFASYYFQGQLLNAGVNIFTVSGPEMHRLYSAAQATIPVHIAIGPQFAFYSPVFLFLLKQISRLDFNAANLIWGLINNAALLISMFSLAKVSGARRSLVNVCALAMLVFFYQPLRENVGIGQSNLLILCSLSLALLSAMNSRDMLSGLFLALAVLIKPHYALVILLLPVKRMWRPFFSALLCYAGLSIIAALILGADFQRDYLLSLASNTVRVAFDPDTMSWGANYSLAGSIVKLFGAGYAFAARAVVLLLAGGAALFTAIRFGGHFKKDTFPLEFACACVLTLLLVPVLELHYLVILYIPLLLLYPRIGELTAAEQVLLVLSFMLTGLRYSLSGYAIFASGAMSLFNNGQLAGMAALLYILIAFHGRRRSAAVRII